MSETTRQGPLTLLVRTLRWPFAAVWRVKSRRLRALLLGLQCLIAAACGVLLWRATSLNGLPDVGDPFDVAAFRAETIAPETDGYPTFLRAASRVREEPFRSSIEAWKAHLDEAIELFKQAADKPDAMPPWRGTDAKSPERDDLLVKFHQLALFVLGDADHREQAGDMDGAWRGYRSVLRGSILISRRDVSPAWWNQTTLADLSPMVAKQVTDWAADPGTSRDLVRKALDDVLALRELSDAPSETIKADYVETLRELDDLRTQNTVGQRKYIGVRFGDMQLSDEQAAFVYQTRRLLNREPERSRRVLRMVFANWLAHEATPRSRRTQPVASTLAGIEVYTAGPAKAPPAALGFEPVKILEWLPTSLDIPWSDVAQNSRKRRKREAQARRDRAAMEYALAEALYRRDHGKPPPNADALVGPYLKSLPDPGPVEPVDGGP